MWIFFCKNIQSFSTYLRLQNLCAVRDFHKCFQSLALYKGREMMECEGKELQQIYKIQKLQNINNIRKPIPGPSYLILKWESLSKEVPQEGTWKVLTITDTYRLLNRSELGVQSDHTKHHWKKNRTKKDYRIIKVEKNLMDCLDQPSTWHQVSDLQMSNADASIIYFISSDK